MRGGDLMKIAIASSGKTLDSLVDPRFGRCPYFLIVDSETKEFKVIENKAGQTFRGAGISAAQIVANEKVEAVFAGNFGPNAVNVLSPGGIRIFAGLSGVSAKKALKQFQEGKLKEAAVSSAAFGPGRSQRGRMGRRGPRG
jgi:predicted Fe-Mo cluster-binding NifX family protein